MVPCRSDHGRTPDAPCADRHDTATPPENSPEIERTVLTSIDLDSESPDQVVERFGILADAGAQHLIFSVRGVADTTRLERIAGEIVPQLRDR